LTASKGTGVGHVISAAPYKGSGAGFGSVFLGSGVVLLAFLGFDSSNTLAAEAARDRNIIPRSLVVTCIIAGLLIFLQLYASGLILPYSKATADTTILDVAMKAGGKILVALYTAGIIIACLLAVTAGQSAAARLLFALGRAGAIPKYIFARRDANPNPRRRVPLINLIMVSLVTLPLCALSSQLTLLTGLSRFMGAFVLLAVNVTMLLYGFFAKNDHNIVTALIIPTFGFFGSLVAWISGTPKQLLIGILILAVGAVLSGLIPRANEQRVFSGDGNVGGGHGDGSSGDGDYSGGDNSYSGESGRNRAENGSAGHRREKREKDILADKSFQLPRGRGRRF
jgi:amino acid transporter